MAARLLVAVRSAPQPACGHKRAERREDQVAAARPQRRGPTIVEQAAQLPASYNRRTWS